MAFITQRTSPKAISIVSILALIIFLPLMLLAVQNIAVLLTRATGVPANIVVDVKTILEPVDTNFYHAFAQGGEESKDMLAPVVSDIRALHPRLIRLDHLYDHYDIVSKNGSDLSYNWANLDAAVDSILATGAKPLLSLSYMPSAIAKDGNIINPPNDWNEWSAVVRATIEHYSGRGAKNIGGVYYEVWNEPDLDQFGGWKTYGDKNYLTLYHYASLGATSATNVNGFNFGGPATTGLYKPWITSLVTSGNRVDFLSWHTYQDDPNKYLNDQKNVATWLLPYPRYTLIPLLITEFGITGSKSKAYGTQYAAAHALAVISKLVTGGPKYLFSFEPVDGPNQQDGSGWGLITNLDNGLKKKPRYYAYNFVDAMAGNRLALSGEGTWVTGFATTKDNVYRILLVNRGSSVSVPVTLNNMPTGTCTFRNNYLFGPDTKVTVPITSPTYQTNVPLTASNAVILELTCQNP